MAAFDLIEEPWIPVTRENGVAEELGLREVLLTAGKIREIRDPLPIVELGLYRLLIALVMDIFELTSENRLGELLNSGGFAANRIEAYFDKHRDRFDLFDERRPFLQTPGMAEKDARPLAGLVPSTPSGTAAAHFHHGHETEFAVSPPAAARLLTTIAPFMTAGGAGLSPSINGAPPWYVLVGRSNLFEILCLNCYAGPLNETGMQGPAWRGDCREEAGRRKGATRLEALTWQPRRIRLIPDGPGRCSLTGRESAVIVREMKFAPGAACDFAWSDPNVAYRITSEKRTPIRPQEGKQLWRDTGPLALLHHADIGSQEGKKIQFERPAVVSQFARLSRTALRDRDRKGNARTLSLQVYGMRTDMKMKVFEWQRETLHLPVPLLWNSRYQRIAQDAIEQAEAASSRLGMAIKHAYPRDGQGNKSAFASLIARAQRGYWERLRPEYNRLLEDLSELPVEGAEEAQRLPQIEWEQAVRRIGRKVLDEAIDDLDTDAAALQRSVNARRFFQNALNKLFAPPGGRPAKAARSST